jgi:hypothetical protein
MLSAVSDLAFLVSTLLKLDDSLGYFCNAVSSLNQHLHSMTVGKGKAGCDAWFMSWTCVCVPVWTGWGAGAASSLGCCPA